VTEVVVVLTMICRLFFDPHVFLLKVSASSRYKNVLDALDESCNIIDVCTGVLARDFKLKDSEVEQRSKVHHYISSFQTFCHFTCSDSVS